MVSISTDKLLETKDSSSTIESEVLVCRMYGHRADAGWCILKGNYPLSSVGIHT